MLEIENCHVNVDGREILKGLDLELPKGQVHAIMGPNGSGKSTLAYVLAGKRDYAVTEGTVSLERAGPAGAWTRASAPPPAFPRLPIPDGDPRRRQHDVPAHCANAVRKARGKAD